MSSKIQQELEKATGVSQESGEGKQTYYKALAKAVNKLSDKDFDALSKGAQDWFNDAADNAEAKRDIPDFPDEQEDEAPTRRRRSAEADDDEPKAKEYVPTKGDKVNITTKRGKVFAGVTFVEIEDDKLIVYKDDEGEADTPLEGAKIEPVDPPKEETASRRRSSKDDADDTPADPKVGDTVEVTNKRGKIYVGILKEDDGEIIVLETVGGDVEDIVKANVTKVVVKHSPKATEKDEPKTTRRGDAKDADSSDGKAKKTTKDDNGGASISDIVNETIVDNLDEPVEFILKKMTKDGVVFREDTAKLNYKQAYKLIAKLRAAKLMK